MPSETEIMWFRRDLRVSDHPALDAARGADRLLCAFVVDPAILGAADAPNPRMSAARVVYLRHALADLAASLEDLGSRLVVRTGDPVEVIGELVRRTGARRVHVSSDHTPFSRGRDQRVVEALGDDVELVGHGGVAIAEPGTVLTGSGSSYKVFTPFHRSWRDVEHGEPLDGLGQLPSPPDDVDTGDPISGDAISDHPLLQASPPPEPWPDGGESAARDRLERWLDSGADGLTVEDYDEQRDVLAAPGTSRMGPDLHFGCLSAREVWTRLDRRRTGHKTFATEIAWRDFYLHVMDAWPDAARTAFRPEYRQLPWLEDEDGFAAWTEGRTGYPIVDAAMRQLRQTGWMHNRARMITASFLCKDLLIDWRRGEQHFLSLLVDGDIASNNGGWQWAAGTGTDAQPFFRIFNPVTQGTRFDPDGDYVRRWVPELADVPTKQIHSPWEMSASEQRGCGVVVGRDYPEPIVDHRAARQRALDWFEQHKG